MRPTAVTVEIDSREKKPLIFPGQVERWDGDRHRLVSVATRRVALDSGDYRLAEAKDLCVVERKGSVRELYTNLLTSDAGRQGRSLSRLSHSSRFPWLCLQAAPSGLLTVTDETPRPAQLLSRLSWCLMKYGLHLLMVPPPTSQAALRLSGELVLHLMLGYMENDEWLVKDHSHGSPTGFDAAVLRGCSRPKPPEQG